MTNLHRATGTEASLARQVLNLNHSFGIEVSLHEILKYLRKHEHSDRPSETRWVLTIPPDKISSSYVDACKKVLAKLKSHYRSGFSNRIPHHWNFEELIPNSHTEEMYALAQERSGLMCPIVLVQSGMLYEDLSAVELSKRMSTNEFFFDLFLTAMMFVTYPRLLAKKPYQAFDCAGNYFLPAGCQYAHDAYPAFYFSRGHITLDTLGFNESEKTHCVTGWVPVL